MKRLDHTGVSPVIASILMVAIAIVLTGIIVAYLLNIINISMILPKTPAFNIERINDVSIRITLYDLGGIKDLTYVNITEPFYRPDIFNTGGTSLQVGQSTTIGNTTNPIRIGDHLLLTAWADGREQVVLDIYF